jgi:hypothetical protein
MMFRQLADKPLVCEQAQATSKLLVNATAEVALLVLMNTPLLLPMIAEQSEIMVA